MLADFEGGYIPRRKGIEQVKEKRFSRNYIKAHRNGIINIIIAICTIATFILLLNLMLNSVFKAAREKQYKQMENAILYVYDELNEKNIIISDVLCDYQGKLTRKVGDVNVTLNNNEISANMSESYFGYVKAVLNFKVGLQYERITDEGGRIFLSIAISTMATLVAYFFFYLFGELFKELT